LRKRPCIRRRGLRQRRTGPRQSRACAVSTSSFPTARARSQASRLT
jgi:hypothetical protein